MKGRFTLDSILFFSCFLWSTTAFSQVSDDCNQLSVNADIQKSCVERNSGGIQLAIKGGMAPYQVRWSHGAKQTQLKSLAPGSYEVTVRDVLGCEQTTTFDVATLMPLDAKPVVINNRKPGKKQGSIEIITSGGKQPYRYSWISNKVQLAEGFIAGANNQYKLPAGWYRVVVLDAAGCYQEVDVQLK